MYMHEIIRIITVLLHIICSGKIAYTKSYILSAHSVASYHPGH